MAGLFSKKSLPTIILIVVIAGYSFYTSVFAARLGGVEESRFMTFFFRVFEVVLFLFGTVYYIKYPLKSNKMNSALWLFWFLLMIRFIYDAFLRTDIFFPISWKVDSFAYMVPLTLWPMLILGKSYDHINYDKALKWIYWMMALSMIMGLFIGGNEEEDLRMATNAAVGSIGTGHLGLSVIILSLIILTQKKPGRLKRIVIYLFLIIAAYIFLRAGSRGPILAGMVCGVVAVLAFTKNTGRNIILLLIVGAIFYAMSDTIVNIVGQVSPVLLDRFELSNTKGGQLHDRMAQYLWAINEFKNHPLFGNAFALYTFQFSDIGIGYVHNAFLEALMQTGIIGGILFFYLYAKTFVIVIRHLKARDPYGWLGLLTIQQMMKIMVSGAFYLTPLVSIGMIIIFSLSDDKKTIKKKFNYHGQSNESIIAKGGIGSVPDVIR